jgi:hypothetical protein
MNFQFILNLLKSGEKIDEHELQAVLQQLEKSLDTLQSEIHLLEETLIKAHTK